MLCQGKPVCHAVRLVHGVGDWPCRRPIDRQPDLGPPFRRSAILEVRHSTGPPRKGAMGNRRLGPLDWTNCYYFILYFMDFPPFLLL